ncbi:hypothetical protein BDR07DRAFT_1310259 [Suillus spraguei]|nr:hypothetical protein BDR07DRAFT_1310259 [Suillus spraguei]
MLLTDESESDDDAEDRHESNSPPSSSFAAVALQLGKDTDEDNNKEYTLGLGQVVDVEDDISGPLEGSRPQQICCFFGQKWIFRIRDIFNWSVEVGWDKFWFQGVKNMESEALFYELMSRLPENEESTSRNGLGESSSMGSGPSSSIVIDNTD